jgi:PKD repeat protein
VLSPPLNKIRSLDGRLTQATHVLANPNVSAPTQFTATPMSGSAPLTVRFAQTATDDYRASIDYGDGTKGTCADCTSKLVHTYTAPGTYTVKLGSLTGTDGATRPPLASVTITVTSKLNNTPESTGPQPENKVVRLDYPRNGDSYAIGTTMHIGTWPKTGMEGGVSLSLVDMQGNEKPLTDLGGDTTSGDWKVGKLGHGDQVVPGTYKVRLRFACNCSTSASDGKFYDSNGYFTITQGSTVPASGVLGGTVTLGAGASLSQAMLSVSKREEKPDPYRGLPYTLTNVGIVEPKSDGTYTMNLEPGTYWIELIATYLHVTGLPTTITVKSGERTTLNYSINVTN